MLREGRCLTFRNWSINQQQQQPQKWEKLKYIINIDIRIMDFIFCLFNLKQKIRNTVDYSFRNSNILKPYKNFCFHC